MPTHALSATALLFATALSTVLSTVLPVAHAQNLIGEIGQPVETGTSGAWARALATDDGWYMGVGTNGDFHIGALTQTGSSLNDWSFDRTAWVRGTDHGGLKDHAIRRCPDGTWLHVASTANNDPNDSAYSWRLSSDFQILASGVVEENYPQRAHNDMATLCSPNVQGAVFTAFGGSTKTATFFHIDETANTSETQVIGEILTEGASFLDDAPTERIILVSASHLYGLQIDTFDYDLNLIDHHELDVPPDNERSFWPQRILRIGQYYVIAAMSMNEAGGSDTGDVWLHVLDEEFNLLEQHRVTNYGSGRSSAMRPWMERMDDLLIVSYDILTTHTFVAIQLNLDGVDDVDTGFPDAGGDGESDDADGAEDAAAQGADAKEGGCSVAGGSVGGMALTLAMVAAARRRSSV